MKNYILKIFTILFLITLVLSTFTDCYSQQNSICEDTSDASSGFGIPKRSPATGQFFRVLILYVAFSDDTVSTSWNIWPKFNKPVNPYTSNGRLIDTSEMSNYTDYTYSKWFQEMSRDSFDFIGDEILVNLPLRALDYKNLNYGYGTMNNVVLNRIDSLVDFSRYDNWKFENGQWVLISFENFPIFRLKFPTLLV